MNYYNLSEFNQVTCSDLINQFHKNGTIRHGSISIYGDSIGKPGDNFYLLEAIQRLDNDTIIFEFHQDKIIVYSPTNIVLNEKVIGIQSAKKIEWIRDNLHLIYADSAG